MKQQRLFPELEDNQTESATPLYQEMVQNYALQIRRMQRNSIIKQKRQAILDKMREEDQKQQVQQTIAQFHNQNTSNPTDNTSEADDKLQPLVIIDETYRQVIEEAIQMPINPQQLKPLVKLIFSLDIIDKHKGVIGVRRILERYPTMIQQIVDEGVIPKMIEFVKDKHHPQLQLEALNIITNICCGTTYHCQMVVKRGGVGLLLDMLASSKREIVDQAMWGLGNIACQSFRDVIVKQNGIQTIVSIVESTPYFKTKQIGSWAISKICLRKPYLKGPVVRSAIKLLANVFATTDNLQEQIEIDMLWVLEVCPDKSDFEALNQSGILPKLMKILLDNRSLLLPPTIKIICRYSCGSKSHIQSLIKQEAVSHLYFLLCNCSESVIKYACFILSNMVINYNKLADQFLEQQTIPIKVVNLLDIGSESVQIEAISFLSALQYASDPNKVVQFYAQNAVLESFFSILQSCKHQETIFAALHGIFRVLQIGQKATDPNLQRPLQYLSQHSNLIIYIQNLQRHDSGKIYNMASLILHTFFVIQDPLEQP